MLRRFIPFVCTVLLLLAALAAPRPAHAEQPTTWLVKCEFKGRLFIIESPTPQGIRGAVAVCHGLGGQVQGVIPVFGPLP